MRRFLWTPEALIFLASTWLAVCCNVGFWRVIADNAPPGGVPGLAYFTSFLVLVIGLIYLVLLLLVHGRATRFLLAVALVVAAGVGYFTARYGVLFEHGMLTNVIETNSAEALELVSLPLLAFVAVAGLLPAIVAWRYPLVRRRFAAATLHRSIALALSLILVAVPLYVNQKEIFSVARNHRETRHMIAPLNVILASYALVEDQFKTPDEFHAIAVDASHASASTEHRRPVGHVLMIGETARASNFRLNGYSLDTNPELAQTDGVQFVELRSCGTATAVSLPCMFSIQQRKGFDRTASKNEDNLLDVAARSGYDVVWIDNGNGCKGICARVNHRDVHASDVDGICPDGTCYDEILVAELRGVLDTISQDTLVVLHGLGSHGPAYFRRYPDTFRVFTPDCRSPNFGDCSPQEISNSYDNTIAYTDHVIAGAIEALSGHSADLDVSLIYVSDHGESLGEHGLYLHGMPYGLAPDEQTTVPLIAWLGPEAAHGQRPLRNCTDDDSTPELSHDNLFHTELGLLGISTAAYKPDLDILSACRDELLVSSRRSTSGGGRSGALR